MSATKGRPRKILTTAEWRETVMKETENADIVKIPSATVFSGKGCSSRDGHLTASRISSTPLPG